MIAALAVAAMEQDEVTVTGHSRSVEILVQRVMESVHALPHSQIFGDVVAVSQRIV